MYIIIIYRLPSLSKKVLSKTVSRSTTYMMENSQKLLTPRSHNSTMKKKKYRNTNLTINDIPSI